MSKLLAIDPGPTESGCVIIDKVTGRPISHGTLDNESMRYQLGVKSIADEVAIEMMAASHGTTPFGKDKVDTVLWIGRFQERCIAADQPVYLYERKTIVSGLTGDAKARDTHVRAACIDFYGGEQAALAKSKTCNRKVHGVHPKHGDCGCNGTGRIGTDGVLSAFAGHEWQALGVGLHHLIVRKEVPFHP